MKSWKLMNVFGIDIEIHWTTILFILFLVLLSPMVALVLGLLFIIISAHELSHSIVAKSMGLDVRRIILLPIGGMAMMEESSLKPEAEFYMAYAGPAMNFVLAGLILAITQAFHLPIYSLDTWNAMASGKIAINWLGFLNSSLFWLNWLLGSFNLFVPAIPMDGGRVFRAFLAMFMDYLRATRIAAIVSKVITATMFVISLFTLNIILMLVAVFIWFGASAEIDQAIANVYVPQIDLRVLVRKRAVVVRENARVRTVAKMMVRRRVDQVFVSDAFHVVSADDLEGADPDTPVGSVAREVKPIDLRKPETIIKSFLAQRASVLPVVQGNRVIGFISLPDIERAVKLVKLLGRGSLAR